MMVWWFVFLLNALAQNTERGYFVHPAQPGVDDSMYRRRGFRRVPPPEPSTMVEPKERDNVFRLMDLEPKLAGWGQMERDLLYFRAKDLALPELQKLYPKLPAEPLERLWRRFHPGR